MTWLFAAVLIAAAPAKSNGPTYTGSKLEQGQKAFNDGQFEYALKALEQAAQENPDPATMEKIQLLRGEAFAAKQDFGHAEEAFALALEANPEAALDPGKVDPAVVKLLESMRARSSGSLSFRSTPPAAHVLVDGAEVGVAPVAVTTGIGRHKVEARWDEGQVAQLEVMVRARRETFVDFVFQTKTVTVEKRVEVKVPVEPPPPPPPAERFAHPWGGARLAADLNAGPELGVDLGGGVDFKYLGVSAFVRPYRYFTVTPRVTGIWPLFDFLNLFAEVDVDLRLTPQHFGVALGGHAGAEVWVQRWLGLFATVGGRGFIIDNGFVVDTRFTISGGVRARLP